MTSQTRRVAILGLVGAAMGFALGRIGFSSYDEVHRMFVFADLRLFLTFCTAVAVLGGVWWIGARHLGGFAGERRIHPGTIPGSILFGLGWAIAGACPAVALVQLGEGQWLAAATLAGIIVGNALYPTAHARWFRWTAGSCADD